MAVSFTDNPQVLGNFNPYIQTLPIDDMVKVGMIKEEQFHQGVQKVQGEVDYLSTLPIAKSEVQGYVKQKLGQLRDTVSKSLAGDFADARIVNQISGAARTISKDPIVQNAVQSTTRMRTALSQLEEAKKGGKEKGYGVENEWALQNSIGSWLNDGQLDTQFSGSYTPYTDIVGEATKLYKEMHPGENINEDSFRTNAQGQVEVNPTMIDGVSPGRIQNVLNLVMQRPDAQQQLNITGQYNYRGATQNDLGHSLASQTNSVLDNIEQTINGLQVKLATDASVSSVAITQQINQLKEQAAQITKGYEGNIALLKANPDALKAKLVGENISNNFTKAFSYETLKKSPLWETQMDIAKYDLQKAEFDYKKLHDADLLDWDKAKEQMRLLKKVDANGNPIEAGTDVISGPGNIQEAAGKLGLSTFNQLYQEKVDAFSQGARKMVFSMVNNLPDKKTAINPVKLDPATQSWEFNVDPEGKTGYRSMAEAKDAYARLYQEVATRVRIGGATPNMMREWQKIDPLLRSMNNYGKVKEDLDTKKQSLITQSVNELKGENPDYVDAFLVKNQTGDWQRSLDKLRQKYGTNWQSKLGIDESTTLTEAGPQEYHGPNWGVYQKFADRMNKSLSPKYRALDEEAKSHQQAQVPIVSTIVAAKPADKEAVRQAYTQKVNEITSGEGDIQYSNKPFREALASKGYEANVYGGYQDPLSKKYYLTVKTDKGPAEKLEVNKTQFESIPGLSTTNSFWQKYGDDLSLTNKTTTDVNNQGQASAYVLDMPPSSKYDIRYHLTMGDTPGKYNVNLYILDKQGKPIISGVNLGLSTSEVGVQTALQQLTNDKMIESIILSNK